MKISRNWTAAKVPGPLDSAEQYPCGWLLMVSFLFCFPWNHGISGFQVLFFPKHFIVFLEISLNLIQKHQSLPSKKHAVPFHFKKHTTNHSEQPGSKTHIHKWYQCQESWEALGSCPCPVVYSFLACLHVEALIFFPSPHIKFLQKMQSSSSNLPLLIILITALFPV